MAEHPEPSELEGGRRLLTRKQALAGGGAAVAALGAPALAASGGREIPHRQGRRAREAQGQPRPHVRLSAGGAPACSSTWAARCRAGSGPDRSIVAFSAQCQHMGCPVAYRRKSRELFCPCHQKPLRPRAPGIDHPGRRHATPAPSPSCRCATGPSTPSAWTASIYGRRSNLAPARRSEVARSIERARPRSRARRSSTRRPGRRGRPRPWAPRLRRQRRRAKRPALFLGQDVLPVPPKDAKVHTSACQYCNVGCGYKIYTWPVEGHAPDRRTPTAPTRRTRWATGSRPPWSPAAASAARTATSPSSPTRTASSTRATTRRAAAPTR